MSEFGDLQALLSLLMVAIAPMSAWATVAAMHVARQGSGPAGVSLPGNLQKALRWWTAAVVAAMALGSAQLARRLELQSIALAYLLLAIVALNAPTYAGQALLQGQARFAALSTSAITLAVVRLVGSIALVVAGFGVLGAASGIVVAYLVTLAYLHFATHGRLARASAGSLDDSGGPGRVIALAAAAGSVVALAHLDVVMAKGFFDPAEAGAYGGIASLGRIVLYGTGSVAAVLAASLKHGDVAAQNRRLTMTALLLTAATGGAVLIVFALAPEWIVRVSIGPRYVPWASLLSHVGLMLLILSLANVLVVHFVATGRSRAVALPVAASTGVALAACTLRHDAIRQLIVALLGSGTLLLAWLGALFARREGPPRR